MRFERILVPVDFSEYSDAAVRIAAALSHRGPTTIMLLHVVPPRSTGFLSVEPMYAPPRVVETLYQEKLGNAEADLELVEGRARKLVAAGTELVAELATGNTYELIVRHAANHDLVVMGSHGLTGAARFLLGSISEKVSRAATCPVIVTPADDLDNGALPRFRRLMVGIDYSPSSERTARVAAMVAEPNAVVELVHVWPSPSLFFAGVDSAAAAELNMAVEEQRGAQADHLAATAGVLQLPGVKTETYVSQGPATDGLLERAAETEPDLIVVGAHSRETLAEKVLGTVADRVLRHAERPVLLVPPPAED